MDSLDYFTSRAEQALQTRPALSAASRMLAYALMLLLVAMMFAAAGLSLIE